METKNPDTKPVVGITEKFREEMISERGDNKWERAALSPLFRECFVATVDLIIRNIAESPRVSVRNILLNTLDQVRADRATLERYTCWDKVHSCRVLKPAYLQFRVQTQVPILNPRLIESQVDLTQLHEALRAVEGFLTVVIHTELFKGIERNVVSLTLQNYVHLLIDTEVAAAEQRIDQSAALMRKYTPRPAAEP